MSDSPAPAGAETTAPEPSEAAAVEHTPDTDNAMDSLPEWARDALTKANKEAAKYRTRAKEFADDDAYAAAKSALAKVAEIEESNKSEIQKATEAREAAEKSAQEAAQQLAIERAARKYGLSDEALEFLSSVPADQIEQRAESLANLLAHKAGPRPDPTQGSTGGGVPATPADQFARAITGQLRR